MLNRQIHGTVIYVNTKQLSTTGEKYEVASEQSIIRTVGILYMETAFHTPPAEDWQMINTYIDFEGIFLIIQDDRKPDWG